jgi:hypothetical protein
VISRAPNLFLQLEKSIEVFNVGDQIGLLVGVGRQELAHQRTELTVERLQFGQQSVLFCLLRQFELWLALDERHGIERRIDKTDVDRGKNLRVPLK